MSATFCYNCNRTDWGWAEYIGGELFCGECADRAREMAAEVEHFCAYEDCDQPVSRDGDLCGAHEAVNLAEQKYQLERKAAEAMQAQWVAEGMRDGDAALRWDEEHAHEAW